MSPQTHECRERVSGRLDKSRLISITAGRIMPRFPSSFCIALVSSARGDSSSVGAWSWSMSSMVSLLFSGMVSLFWNCGSLSNILSTDSIMRSWLLHLVTHAWVGRTPSLSASSVFRVLFSFYKFCWCDDLAHISMSVYRFFRRAAVNG